MLSARTRFILFIRQFWRAGWRLLIALTVAAGLSCILLPIWRSDIAFLGKAILSFFVVVAACTPLLAWWAWIGGDIVDSRIDFLARCRDTELLTDVAFHGREDDMRTAALINLSDDALLRVARESAILATRVQAVGKIADEAILRQLVQSDADAQVRRAAVCKLTDQATLAAIARSDADAEIRAAAAANIRDQAVLKQVVQNDPAESVRLVAFWHIDDDAFLLQRAQSGDINTVCFAAAKRIRSLAALEKLALSVTGFPEMTEYALIRLSCSKQFLRELTPERGERLVLAAEREGLGMLRLCPDCGGMVTHTQWTETVNESVYSSSDSTVYEDVDYVRHRYNSDCCNKQRDEDFSVSLRQRFLGADLNGKSADGESA